MANEETLLLKIRQSRGKVVVMKKKTKSIYIIKNKINDKVYIGQTGNLTQRWAQYKSAVKKEYDSQIIFRAMRKYGFENF